jgi:hypothetical protein
VDPALLANTQWEPCLRGFLEESGVEKVMESGQDENIEQLGWTGGVAGHLACAIFILFFFFYFAGHFKGTTMGLLCGAGVRGWLLGHISSTHIYPL